VQSLTGISIAAGSDVSVVGNLVSNLQNNYAPAATTTTRVVGGIINTNGVVSIVGNTISNLRTGADAAWATAAAGTIWPARLLVVAPAGLLQYCPTFNPRPERRKGGAALPYAIRCRRRYFYA